MHARAQSCFMLGRSMAAATIIIIPVEKNSRRASSGAPDAAATNRYTRSYSSRTT